MACKIKYIENNYRKEYPELADRLSEIHNNVWKDVINSKLFRQEGVNPTQSTYLFSKIGTEANKKQISFVNSLTEKYGGKVIIAAKTKDGFNTKVVVGVNSLAQIEYNKLQKPVQGTLFDDNSYLQLSSNLINPVIDELDNYLLDFLKGFNVKFKQFEELKSRLGVDALGATDVLNKLIWYVKNRNEETLPEESAHMLVALMGENHPDIKELLDNILNWSEYNSIKDTYLPIYNDENKVKIEAVGKLIAKSLVKNYKANGLDKSKLQKALDRILNFIEDILNSLNLASIFMYNESIADHIAINVLSGNKDYIYKIKNLNSNVNAQKEINSNPNAKNIINKFSSDNVKMTGSLAIAGTENIRRPEGQGIHDIDFKVKSFEIFSKEILPKIPENAVPAHYGWHKKSYSTFAYLIPIEGYRIEVLGRKNDFSNGWITSYKLFNEKNEKVEITQANVMSVDFFVYKNSSNQKDFKYSSNFIPATLVYEGKMSLGGKSNPYFFSRDKDQEDYVLRDPKSFIPFEKHIYYQLNNNTKQGVQELFDSNPELANQVYEALGFKTKIFENQITRAIKEELPYKVIGNYNEIDEGLIGRRFYEEKIDNNIYKFEISNYNYPNEDGSSESFYDIDFTVNGSEDIGFGFFDRSEKGKQIIQALLSQNFGNDTVRFNVDESKKGKQRLILYKRLMNQLGYNPFFEMEYGLFYNIKTDKVNITPQQKQQALQLYSQYLDTIFPDSKVKNIVYHISNKTLVPKKGQIHFYLDSSTRNTKNYKFHILKNIESKIINKERNSKNENLTKEESYIFDNFNYELFTADWYRNPLSFYNNIVDKAKEDNRLDIIEYLKGKETITILNVQNPYNENNESLNKTTVDTIRDKTKTDGIIGKESWGYGSDKSENQIVVFEPEQIHILGSKQDIEGFKNWNSKAKTFASSKSNSETLENKINKLLPNVKGIYSIIFEQNPLQSLYDVAVQANSSILDKEGVIKVVGEQMVKLAEQTYPMASVDFTYQDYLDSNELKGIAKDELLEDIIDAEIEVNKTEFERATGFDGNTSLEDVKKVLTTNTLNTIDETILKTNPNLKINVGFRNKTLFDPSDNSININLEEIYALSTYSKRKFDDVLNDIVMHELRHAQTDFGLKKGINDKEFIEFLDKLKELHKTKPFVDELRGGYTFKGEPYTYQNIYEMVADHFSNPSFKKYLQENSFNENTTFLQKLINIIYNLLRKIGINVESENSLYNELSNLIVEKNILQENYLNSQAEKDMQPLELVYRNAASITQDKKKSSFEEMDDLLLVKEVADIFDAKRPEIIDNIKKITKSFRKNQKYIADGSLKTSMNKIIDDLQSTEANANTTKTIISHIYNTLLVFKKLERDMLIAQNIEDNDLKLQTLYAINSIAEEHSGFLDTLGQIKRNLISINKEEVSILTEALTEEQRKQNSLVIRNLLRVLEQPLAIMETIKGVYNDNNESLVAEKLYEENKLTAEAGKAYYLEQIRKIEESLKTATNPKVQLGLKKDIEKLQQQIKKLPLKENNNIKEWISQKNGDINVLNERVESATVSRSPLVQSLSSMIKDDELRAKDVLYPILEEAQGIFNKYLVSEKITNFDTVKYNKPFLNEHTVIDKLVWNKETKEFEDPITHKQEALINVYTDEYQYAINLFKKKLEVLFYEIQNTKDETEIENLTNIREKIKKDYSDFTKENVEDKYIPEVMQGLELLDENIDGTTLRKYRSALYDDVDYLERQIADHDLSDEAKNTYLQSLQEAHILLNGLSSTYGKSEDSLEYKLAIQAKNYKEALKKYRISTITNSNLSLYSREYKKNKELYINAIGTKNEEKAKENWNIWLSQNTRVEINPIFFEQRKKLAEELDALRLQLIEKGVISTTNKEKSKDGYNTLKDISVKYREFDGQINGNIVKEEEAKTIKEIQEELEKFKQEIEVRKNGLTNQQLNRYKQLDKIKSRSNSEQVEYEELDSLKKAAALLLEQNKDLVKQYDAKLKELLDISEGSTTRFYDEQMANIKQQLVNKRIELMISDKPIFISDKAIFIKEEDGRWKNTVSNLYIREERLIIMIENTYKNGIVSQSEWFKNNHYKRQGFDKNGKPIEIDEPLYQWKVSRPSNPDFIKESPSLKYYTTTFTEEALNPNYKQLPNRLPLPKSTAKEIYLNEEFNTLSNNKKEYLNYIRNTFYKFQIESEDDNSNLGDLIPTKRRSASESNLEFLKGNIVDNIKEKFNDNFRNNEQDTDEGYVKKDAIANKIIPSYMSSRIESKDQSVDILGLVLEFGYFAERRKGMVDMQAFAESLVNASKEYSKTTLQQLNNAATIKDKFKSILQIAKGNTITTTTEGIVSNETKALVELVNTGIYGQTKINSGNPFIEKGADWLMKRTAGAIFFLNAFSPLKNTLSAKLQFYISSIANVQEWAKAESTFVTHIPELLKDIHKIGDKSLIGQILEKYEGLQGSVFESISRKVQSNVFKNSTNIFSAMKQFSEYELQAVFTIAMLQKEKVQLKDGTYVSLFNAYEKTKNGIELKKEIDQTKFTDKHRYDFVKRLHKINLETQGAYRMEERNNLQKTVGGRLLFFMGQYFVPGITKRYGKERYYTATGKFEQGFYRIAYNKLIKDWYEYGTDITKRWSTMSEDEKTATIRFLKEFGTILTIALLVAAMGGGDPDRFKNSSKTKLFMLALLKGVSSETQTLTPWGGADEILRKVSNPFIVTKTIKNVAKLLIYSSQQMVGDDDAFYKQNTGIFKEGDSKAFATLMQLSGFSMSNIFLMDGELLLKRQENATRLR